MSDSQKYTAEETAQKRDHIVKVQVAAAVAEVFHQHPALQSACLRVAQYWDDGANDAVHLDIVLSELPTPHLSCDAQVDGDADYGFSIRVNLPTLSVGTTERAWELERQVFQAFENDDNGDNIPYFAAFCQEGCDQEMPWEESYTPYAYFRRNVGSGDQPDGISVEVVGVMLRPWLDGIRPEYEDGREEQPSAQLSATPQSSGTAQAPGLPSGPINPTEVAPKKQTSFLGRIFGR